MKKGKINLLSFEEDDQEEEGVNFSMRQQKKPQQTPKSNPVHFDLSQIRDRVSQMEMNEEMILEGEAAAAFMNESAKEDEEEADAEMTRRVKEARQKRSLFALASEDVDGNVEESSDYIPITTKSEYWLARDTRESEETFHSTSDSRLVREDLFNEREVDDPTGAFTSFLGTGASGRQGLMMTAKMLERDIKTDMYDLELGDGKSDDEDDDLGGAWERGQVLKGIEKGWDSTDTEAGFYSKQAKLKQFIPPPKFPTNPPVIEAPIDTTRLEENIQKIGQDSNLLESRIGALKLEIKTGKSDLNELAELEIFFTDFSQFLAEKFVELREIEEEKDRERWIHFFDNSPEDFLNLPEIIGKATKLNLSTAKHLSELTGLFVRYLFLFLWDAPDPKDIWDASGLKEALGSNTTALEELFREIYVNEEDKYQQIKIIFE